MAVKPGLGFRVSKWITHRIVPTSSTSITAKMTTGWRRWPSICPYMRTSAIGNSIKPEVVKMLRFRRGIFKRMS